VPEIEVRSFYRVGFNHRLSLVPDALRPLTLFSPISVSIAGPETGCATGE